MEALKYMYEPGYSENFTLEKSYFTLENPSKFSSRSRENGAKNLV